jgi:excinuclease ABC subunit C
MPTPFDADTFLKNLTTLPGVYRMLDAKGQVLYVGKARNLKRRVSSYFRNQNSAKIHSLIQHTQAIEVTVTHTETEALLLESNLIKKLKPRYNVLLRDDKGYPYIYMSGGDFPRLTLHRGAKQNTGHYFGPYPSAGAVRETLSLLQKIFRLRQCDDSFFQNRSRPCLQYQIKRCTAPCTGLIDQSHYQQDVRHATLFLEGKSGEVIDELVQRMETASAELDFEAAASYRDQIVQLRKIQERQYVTGKQGDLDVIACTVRENSACVQVFFFRDGRLLGNKHFFPTIPEDTSPPQVLSAFLTQYYLNRPIPNEILVNQALPETALLTAALGERAGRRVLLSAQVRGERTRWLAMAEHNAELALQAQLAGQVGMRRRFEALQDALGLDAEPTRLECFDVSHTQGEATVASCVVFNGEGPVKSDYRRYNITDVTPGDDYGAMRQALNRRYTRLRTEDGKVPDILFVDGGKGQVRQARQVLEELQLVDVTLVGVAKGTDRKVGLEVLYLSEDNRPIILSADSPALHLIQQIRDEAHRFAITGHRKRRAKARNTSVLEHIPGIGHKRRRSLLKQFGGLKQLARAGVEDIARIEGISQELAQRIYDRFHNED